MLLQHAHDTTATAETRLDGFDRMVNGFVDRAADRASKAAKDAFKRGATVHEIADAIRAEAAHLARSGRRVKIMRTETEKHAFEALYEDVRAGRIPSSSYAALRAMLQYARVTDAPPEGWLPSICVDLTALLIGKQNRAAVGRAAGFGAGDLIGWRAQIEEELGHRPPAQDDDAWQRISTAADRLIARFTGLRRAGSGRLRGCLKASG